MTISIFLWSVLASIIGSAIYSGTVYIFRHKNDRRANDDHFAGDVF